MRQAARNPRGFSLIELVIVLAIAGVIGAIAVPRLTGVSENAPATAYLADLSVIQSAVERFTAEHQGLLPDQTNFALQLTQYTDLNGNLSVMKTNTHLFGPYLRRMPELSILPKAQDLEAAKASRADLSDGSDAGEVVLKTAGNKATAFVYDPATGRVRVKVTGTITAQSGG